MPGSRELLCPQGRVFMQGAIEGFPDRKIQPHIVMIMSLIKCIVNGVNETVENDDGFSPGSDGVSHGLQQATARRKWSSKLYRVVKECYFESRPGNRGYTKRMLSTWQNRGIFRVTEQNLADQARAIKNKQLAVSYRVRGNQTTSSQRGR